MRGPQQEWRPSFKAFRATLSVREVRGTLGQLAIFIIVPVLYLAFAPWYVNVICAGAVGLSIYYALRQHWFGVWWIFVRLLLFIASIITLQFFMPRPVFLGSILLLGVILYYVGWEIADRRWRFSGGIMMVWALLSFWLTLGDRTIDGFR